MSILKTVGTFVPSEMVVAINHVATGQTFVIQGFSSDSMISIERANATWESDQGIDGLHQRIHRLDKTYRATLSLMQTSHGNDLLSAVALYDEQDLRGGGLFTCTITDKSGRSHWYSDQAYVIEPSNMDFNQSASNRDWIIVLPYCETQIGGSTLLDQDTVNILSKFGVEVPEDWIR